MAEPDFTGLDGRLRNALGRAAEQGDSAGVADAIRSRVAAGDSGTSAAGPVAPGWGRRLFGMLLGGILLGVVIVGATATGVGFALTAGDQSQPTAEPSLQVSPSSSPTPSATPAPAPSPTPTPTPTVIEPPAPAPAPAPPPAADTTPPTVQASSSAAVIFAGNGSDTTITAIAADDVAIADVSITWVGFASGSAVMAPSGGAWTAYIEFPPTPAAGAGQVDFVVTAVDPAGNATSATFSVPVIP